MADKKFLDYTGLNYFWGKIKALIDKKVDGENGKGLSTNDYTTDEKIKLASIEADADVNILEGIEINGTTVTPTNKIANLDLSKYGAELVYDSKTHVITLKGKTGDILSTVDLPIESVVTNGEYDETTKEVILTLQNGSKIKFSIADLVSGLVSSTTFNNTIKQYVSLNGDQDIQSVKTFKEGFKIGTNLYTEPLTDGIPIKGGLYSSPDLNQLTARGIYHCTKGTNTPSFDHANSQYDLMVFNSSEYETSGAGAELITQMVIIGFKWWIRTKHGSTWNAWERFGQATVINPLTETEIDSIINAAS